MERRARRYLERAGLKFVCANYRVRGGEIDLIMSAPDCLVFVEVRYRPTLAQALESVQPAKQRRIVRCARRYLLENNLHRQQCRFDLVALSGGRLRPSIKWLPNAWRDY